MQHLKKIYLSTILILIISLFTIVTTYGSTNRATIVGGKEAVPYSYPFMVSIQYKSSSWHFCGGSLISPNTVITAAHCTKGKSAANLQVVIGEHNLAIDEGVEQVIDVSEIVIHDNFNFSTLKDDISLLHLSTPAVLGDSAQIIPLPNAGEEFSGTTTTIGWGRLSSGGKTPDALNEVDIDLVEFDDCNASYDNKILPGMICASLPGKDSCQGDSGGPLFQNGKLVGLTSWGYGCASPDYPGVYTQVSNYIDFINEKAWW